MNVTGLYVKGDTLLHRLDVRLKLGMLLVLVVSLFSAPSLCRLLLLCGICAFAIASSGLKLSHLGRRFLGLRWLLLATLLLHLFFTPGRTLFGTTWLSYDGLLRGLTVDLQLLLTLFFSYLMALTTSPAALAWGLGVLFSPLSRFGVPVREGSGLMLLTLHFVPLVREGTRSLKEGQVVRGFLGRIRSTVNLVGPLLVSLVDQADALAHRIVSEGMVLEPEEWDNRFSSIDLLTMIFGVPVMVLLWVC